MSAANGQLTNTDLKTVTAAAAAAAKVSEIEPSPSGWCNHIRSFNSLIQSFQAPVYRPALEVNADFTEPLLLQSESAVTQLPTLCKARSEHSGNVRHSPIMFGGLYVELQYLNFTWLCVDSIRLCVCLTHGIFQLTQLSLGRSLQSAPRSLPFISVLLWCVGEERSVCLLPSY